LEKRIINSIATAANTEIKTMITTATALVSLHIINHVALYIIKKAANCGTIPKKNKSLKLNSRLLIKISLANLTTDLINNLINILYTIRIIILT
jgi:hypothetical protein